MAEHAGADAALEVRAGLWPRCRAGCCHCFPDGCWSCLFDQSSPSVPRHGTAAGWGGTCHGGGTHDRLAAVSLCLHSIPHFQALRWQELRSISPGPLTAALSRHPPPTRPRTPTHSQR